MSVKLNSVKIDTDSEVNGAWEDSVAFPGVSYLVKGIKNEAFETARDLAFQRLAKAYKTMPIPGALRTKTLGGLVGEHLLFGWKGFDEEYDRDGAAARLSDPAYRNLLDDVLRAAATVAERNLEFTEVLAKN